MRVGGERGGIEGGRRAGGPVGLQADRGPIV
jgi:hypothetical protein